MKLGFYKGIEVEGTILDGIRMNLTNTLMRLGWLIHPAMSRQRILDFAEKEQRDRHIFGDSYTVVTLVSPPGIFIKSQPELMLKSRDPHN